MVYELNIDPLTLWHLFKPVVPKLEVKSQDESNKGDKKKYVKYVKYLVHWPRQTFKNVSNETF